MKKMLLSLSVAFLTLQSQAQTTTVLQDFNYTVTDQASFNVALADQYWYSGTNWTFVNYTNFVQSLGYTVTANNAGGLAGFTVGEKLVYSNVYNPQTGVGPVGTTPVDSIWSSIGVKATLDAAKTYQVKFDVSPKKSVTYDKLDVGLLRVNANGGYISGSYIPVNTLTFNSSDFGKQTVTLDLPAGYTTGDWAIAFDHYVSALDAQNQTPGGHLGGLFLDKITLIENAPSSASIEELDFMVNAFPNPANEVLSIFVNNTMESISIISMDGKVLVNELIIGTEATVNVSDLKSGVYFYEVRTLKGAVIRKTFLKN